MEINTDNLIDELINKNPKTLEYIIEEYSKVVYTFVYRIIGNTGSKEDIEECVSDVFVEVWNNVNDFDSTRGSFKTWILIKAKYKALDYRRKLKKIIDFNEYNKDIDKIKSIENIEDIIVNKEKCEVVLQALNELNEKDKEIFIRRYFLYEKIENMTKKLNLSRKAIDNRLYRGRKKLKESLKEYSKERLYR